jgi:hypothetical protein
MSFQPAAAPPKGASPVKNWGLSAGLLSEPAKLHPSTYQRVSAHYSDL